MPELNRSLLSVMLDGKIRMLIIRNAANKMIARSLFRILYDEKNKIPVLFMGETYVSTGYDIGEAREIMELLALRRAKDMGINITSSRSCLKGENKYPSALISYGGPSIDEYIDVLGNEANVNRYRIEGDKLALLVKATTGRASYNLE